MVGLITVGGLFCLASRAKVSEQVASKRGANSLTSPSPAYEKAVFGNRHLQDGTGFCSPGVRRVPRRKSTNRMSFRRFKKSAETWGFSLRGCRRCPEPRRTLRFQRVRFFQSLPNIHDASGCRALRFQGCGSSQSLRNAHEAIVPLHAAFHSRSTFLW